MGISYLLLFVSSSHHRLHFVGLDCGMISILVIVLFLLDFIRHDNRTIVVSKLEISGTYDACISRQCTEFYEFEVDYYNFLVQRF